VLLELQAVSPESARMDTVDPPGSVARYAATLEPSMAEEMVRCGCAALPVAP